MMELVFVTLVATVLGAILTPVVRSFAFKTGFVDQPDGRRKLHLKPVALGGGVAVFVSAFLSLLCSALVHPLLAQFSDEPSQVLFDSSSATFFLGLFGASAFLVMVGLIDDRYQLRGRQKLLGQMLAVSILLASGLVVSRVQLFEWQIELGLLSYPFTMFWLLGAINALNLIDGLDGLAGSVGVVLSLAIAAMALLTGHGVDAIIALSLCGAVLGFLIYNLPPATIYLGDAGSMLIGLLLGALAMRSSFKAPATVALMAPTVIWAIPILDVGMAILRRKLTGRSIYETDRGHLHHCLLRSGVSGKMTVIWIGLFCSITAFGALISVLHQNEWMAAISAVSVFGALVVTRLFGHAECMLLGGRLKSIISSLMPTPHRAQRGSSMPVHARLTGTRDWEELWETLTQYAERFDLSSVQLNVNLPALNEEYHVNWNRRDRGPELQQWTTDIPLVVGRTTAGRLRISGRAAEGSACQWMGELISGLKPFETQISTLLSDQLHLPLYQASEEANPDRLLLESNS